MTRVEELRKLGAKHVFLKTGAYRPADLARAVKFASKAKLDLLTVDGAGGGTGMSPWRMMNEWGVPTVEIWSLTWKYADQLAKQGEFVPDLAFAGGITFEDQIFKALALGAPYVKAVGMARCSAGRGHGRQDHRQPHQRRPGPGLRRALRQQQGRDLRHRSRAAGGASATGSTSCPTGAIGVYTYFKRLSQGLRQMMAGERKFTLDYITRDDIASLTKEAADISGIPYITDVDKDEVQKILKAK